jgi:Family of unknown function (DUF6010)
MPPFNLYNVPMPVTGAVGVILLASFARVPARQNYMAILVAVAGGAYLDGGLGPWEFPISLLVGYCASQGLHPRTGYNYIAAGWLVHTACDVHHHVKDPPMVKWIPTSLVECAITDAVLAAWMFLGARGLFDAREQKA